MHLHIHIFTYTQIYLISLKLSPEWLFIPTIGSLLKDVCGIDLESVAHPFSYLSKAYNNGAYFIQMCET